MIEVPIYRRFHEGLIAVAHDLQQRGNSFTSIMAERRSDRFSDASMLKVTALDQTVLSHLDNVPHHH